MKKYILGLSVLVLVFSVFLGAPQNASAYKNNDRDGKDIFCQPPGTWFTATGRLPSSCGAKLGVTPNLNNISMSIFDRWGNLVNSIDNTNSNSGSTTIAWNKANPSDTSTVGIFSYSDGKPFFSKQGISENPFGVTGLAVNKTYYFISTVGTAGGADNLIYNFFKADQSASNGSGAKSNPGSSTTQSYDACVPNPPTTICGKLKVSKKVPGGSTQAFSFSLEGIKSNGVSTGIKYFTLQEGQTQTFPVYYNNTTYTVHEDSVSSFTPSVSAKYLDYSGNEYGSAIYLLHLDASTVKLDLGGSWTGITFTNTKKPLFPIDTHVVVGPALSINGQVIDSTNTNTTGYNNQLNVLPALLKPCLMKIGGSNDCGKLVIIKDTGAFSPQTFNFTGSMGAFTLDNDGGSVAPYTTIPKSRTFDVTPGTYTVSEVPTSGYYLSSVSCVTTNPNGLKNVTYNKDSASNLTGLTVGVPVGETITCTFNNIALGTNTNTGGNTATNTTGQIQGMEGTVVGALGKILYSSNQGSTWSIKSSGVNADLEGVSFADKYNGIAVGQNGAITKSVNDGVTWTAQTSGTTKNLNGVSFSTPANATAVGNLGTIIRTVNGGGTWTAQTSGTTKNLNSVSFFGINNGFAVGDNGVTLHTINGGALWSYNVFNTFTNFHGVYMSTALIATAVGTDSSGNGFIVRTINGGLNWTAETVPVSVGTRILRSVWFDSNGMNGTIVGDQGLILTTINGGTTWTIQTNAPTTSTFGSQDFRSVSYYKAPYTNFTTGVVVSIHNTTARTTNGGSLWTDIINPYTGTNTSFNGVDLH